MSRCGSENERYIGFIVTRLSGAVTVGDSWSCRVVMTRPTSRIEVFSVPCHDCGIQAVTLRREAVLAVLTQFAQEG